MSFTFGSFANLCYQIAMPLCSLVEKKQEPSCYSRNIEIGGFLIFEPATLVIHMIALIMTGIMIYHVKSKYTAVGRKEIAMFFYLYALTILVEFLVISGIIPMATPTYNYFVAAYHGLVMSTLWCLLLNGFVGFQWAEDGTPTSLWSIRISSLIIFIVSFVLSIGTFNSFAGLSPDSTMPLFIVYLIFSVAFILIYVVFQIVLVLNTLDDRWPLGDIFFGLVFFITGQICQYVISKNICEMLNHYIDGLFFGTTFSLLAVMMVYKYWDSITKEDLEFSVGAKSNMWEVKNPLLADDSFNGEFSRQ